jgi:stage III sporulation protein AG
MEGSKLNKNMLRNVLILGIVGVLLLFVSNNFFSNNTSTPSVTNDSSPGQEDYLKRYEEKLARELEEIISLVDGVGDVKVKVYVQTGSIYEYEYDSNQVNKITSETDQNGGRREIKEDNRENKLLIVENAQGDEKPIIKKEVFPVIAGILIVAQGAEVSKVKYKIIRSVSVLFDLPVYKISVLPYERR